MTISNCAAFSRARTINFVMRVSEWDAALLDALKDELGMTKSELIRYIILHASPYERCNISSETAAALVSEINHYGKQVNEIAHFACLSWRLSIQDFRKITGIYMGLCKIYVDYAQGNSNS